MEKINNNSFDHFIITRFNLKNKDWTLDKNANNICDEEWLKFRYEVFTKTCYNSIKNQDVKNFKWLVYFDTNTPELYKDINKKLHTDFPLFTPLYRDSNQQFLDNLADDIKSLTTKDYIITTRIDNDDAFHYKAIETIQKEFDFQEEVIINLPWIICFDMLKKRMSKHYFVSNPFISLIEKKTIETFKTVFSKQHNEWRKSNEIININDKKPYCFQLIHERNICNNMQGQYINDNFIAKHFNLLLDVSTSIFYPLFVLKNKSIIYIKRIQKFVFKVLKNRI
tara:strand:- start:416 stop:1258 length:843 start_codon:yes stop_codon:yes gene_type:complete